jgi:predicted NACHT family NTPase
MSKFVVINMEKGNLKDGFSPVTAQLWENNSRPIKFVGSLPAAPEIYELYKHFKLIYKALYNRFGSRLRIKINSQDLNNVSEASFNEIQEQLYEAINAWLNSDSFRPIDQKLREKLSLDEEFQVIIEASDILLQRLPWHLWNFVEHYQLCEVAVSTSKYERVKPLRKPEKNQVRILAILGDSQGIDVKKDRNILEQLLHASTVFLVEPSRQELDKWLWDEQGWDILFFAGHSHSQDNKGQICINKTSSLKISELKNALTHAVSHGLKIAIFNSCDGLGLAQQLSNLHIPQIVVMREEIPDFVAQEFVKYFLGAFSGGQSFYLAVRYARLRLQGLEDEFPGASWLPVIYQNPAEHSLNWQELRVNSANIAIYKETNINIDTLIEDLHEKIKLYIQERLSYIRVLDMANPINLSYIYTHVNVLDIITKHRRLEIEDLLKDAETLDRVNLSSKTRERLAGYEAVQRYSRLMVLGKPGAGKTTFLKDLAIQCIYNNFQNNYIPIFINLKNFAETPEELNILEYIAQELSLLGVTDAYMKIEQLLQQGKLFLLLDGLDEVREEHTKRVIKKIQEVSDRFHSNKFVLTCRIAASEYVFERFTEVELADFDEEQIAIFAKNWFFAHDTPAKAESFIQKLKENKSIRELATNPLLLTLLCLAFGDKETFPKKLSQLYQEALRLLLKQWDAKIYHERQQVSEKLSVKHKEDLLCQIALKTFERGAYFFDQEEVEEYIADFIGNLQHIDPDPELLRLNSETVLKSIEVQHGLLIEQAKGIYSFSHLTFQEYFVARAIKQRSDLEHLVKHITQTNWREVFLLTTEMLTNPDNLLHLMKQRVDALLATDEYLTKFHSWVSKKSSSVKAPYIPTAVRAFYCNVVHDLDHDLIYNIVSDSGIDFTLTRNIVYILAHNPIIDLNTDLNRAITFACCLNLSNDYESSIAFEHGFKNDCSLDYYILTRVLGIDIALDIVLVRILEITSQYINNLDTTSYYISNTDDTLQHQLQQLKDQLPNLESHSQQYKQWWQEHGNAWIKQLRTIAIQHRNIGFDWQFSDSQKELLNQYYSASKLLLNCLNSNCNVSQLKKREILDTLLLPSSVNHNDFGF